LQFDSAQAVEEQGEVLFGLAPLGMFSVCRLLLWALAA